MNKPYKTRFKAGEWTPVAVAGESIDGRTITRDFLEKAVQNYEPTKNGIRAKIKIGHTKPSLPEGKAYGYFSELRMSPTNPDIMEGKPEWVHEELIEKLEKGEYRDISPEFRPILKRSDKPNADGEYELNWNYYFAGVAVLGESHPAFPLLSANFNSTIYDNIAYTSNMIGIEQDNTTKTIQGYTNINEDYNRILEEYESLKQDYNQLSKENKRISVYYNNMLEELKRDINQLKSNSRQNRVIEFCEQSLKEGKLEPYELMKNKPDDTIAECGLVKHMLSLSNEQLDFEMSLISTREANNRHKPIIDTKYNKSGNTRILDDKDFEEQKFMEFCEEQDYNLNNIKEIDKAYKEWRNYVKH